MFRGASALEGEVTDTAEFDTVTDELGGGQVFQKTNASGLSRMVY